MPSNNEFENTVVKSDSENESSDDSLEELNDMNLRRAIHNSLRHAEEVAGEDVAGPSRPREDFEENYSGAIHDIELDQKTKEVLDKEGKIRTSESTTDTILEMAPTPSFEEGSDIYEMDAFSNGMQSEVRKASKVWDSISNIDSGHPNAGLIVDYYRPKQKARVEIIEGEIQDSEVSELKKQHLRGRKTSIEELLRDIEGLIYDRRDRYLEERNETDEALGKSKTPTPPATPPVPLIDPAAAATATTTDITTDSDSSKVLQN